MEPNTSPTTAGDMRDHWVWRPEWTPERTCLYWYLTFAEDEVSSLLADASRAAEQVDWLDVVPARWCHLTVADVGFTDELDPGVVEEVRSAAAGAVAGVRPLRLTVGAVYSGRTALMMPVQPAERVHALRERLVRATRTALDGRAGQHDMPRFRPHLSLAYVNRPVDAASVERLLHELPVVAGTLEVDAVTLAAVTRREHRYRWEQRSLVGLA